MSAKKGTFPGMYPSSARLPTSAGGVKYLTREVLQDISLGCWLVATDMILRILRTWFLTSMVMVVMGALRMVTITLIAARAGHADQVTGIHMSLP